VKTDLSAALFSLDPYIRYVAVNQSGTITEMEQRAEWPSNNPPETDRLEELIVNPLVLEAARRRGDLDLGGVRYVIIRYGMQYQAIFRFGEGHLSVGVELAAEVDQVAQKIAAYLNSR
jgi:hypothetical protein